MTGHITPILIGIMIIIIGISNMKGNISLLHSYHHKRVKKEDEKAFGKMVGRGTIIIGCTTIIAGVVDFLLSQTFQYITNIILLVGFISGFIIIFYALFKYNKGIF